MRFFVPMCLFGLLALSASADERGRNRRVQGNAEVGITLGSPDYRYYARSDQSCWDCGDWKDSKEWKKDRREALRERQKDLREAWREAEKDRREAAREWEKAEREAWREEQKARAEWLREREKDDREAAREWYKERRKN